MAALWIHVVLTHEAQFTSPDGLTSTCRCCCWRSLWGRCWPLDGARGRGPADGPWGRSLVLHQLEADLLDELLHGHARQRAAGALHLLEQRGQLSLVALWEAGSELLQDLVEFASRGRGGRSGRGSGGGGRWGWSYRVDGLNRRGRGETGRRSHPHLSSDVRLEVRLVLGWEGGLELLYGWWWAVCVVVAVLGVVRGLVLLLIKVWVSRGMEGSVHWNCGRKGHELGADQ